MSKKGWVCIHRSVQNHWLWDCEFSYGQAWVDIILQANHSDKKIMIKGQVVDIKRGQQARSEVTLSKTWKWSRNKVRRFLKNLENEGMIEVKATHLTSIITVCNYDDFQDGETTGGTTKGQQTEQLKDNRRNTNNNGNNGNNEDKAIVEAEPQRSKFKFNDDQYRFAEEMFKRISKVAPSMKRPNVESWANTIRLLNETDQINLNAAWEVFCWANSDSFWSTNILSADKFRKQYVQLSAKMKGSANQPLQPQVSRPSRKEIKL